MKLIATALVKAQKGFAPALKTNTNPHFRSKYADLSACVEAVIDALNANGIALIQKTRECADGVIVETVFLHESGETIEAGPLHVPAPKNDPQGFGSALTYARRYSLMAACGIAPEDDDGNAASKPAPVSTVNQRVADVRATLRESIENCKTLDDLEAIWGNLHFAEKKALEAVKEAAKAKLSKQKEAA